MKFTQKKCKPTGPVDGGIFQEAESAVTEPHQLAVQLQDLLLSFGGQEVLGLGITKKLPNFDVREMFLDPLLKRGIYISGQGAHLRKRGMEPCNCHGNAYNLFKERREPVYATGFALTLDDGFWRPHSWCMSKKNTVVETTSLRDTYFGIFYFHSQGKR